MIGTVNTVLPNNTYCTNFNYYQLVLLRIFKLYQTDTKNMHIVLLSLPYTVYIESYF